MVPFVVGVRSGRQVSRVFFSRNFTWRVPWIGLLAAFDARKFFDPGDTEPFRRNQFGGFVGGPIVRDRTFFFASYEALRERLALTHISTVPDANAHLGILPGGNVTVSPAIKPYLDLYPFPNGGQDFGDGTAEYLWSFSNPAREDFGTIRVDHQFSDNQLFFGRLTIDDAEVVTPRSFPDFYNGATSRNIYTTLEEKTIISPTSLNVFRFAFNRPSAWLSPSSSIPETVNALAMILGRLWQFRFSLGAASTNGALSELGPLSSQLVRLPQNIFQLTDDVHLQRQEDLVKIPTSMHLTWF